MCTRAQLGLGRRGVEVVEEARVVVDDARDTTRAPARDSRSIAARHSGAAGGAGASVASSVAVV